MACCLRLPATGASTAHPPSQTSAYHSTPSLALHMFPCATHPPLCSSTPSLAQHMLPRAAAHLVAASDAQEVEGAHVQRSFPIHHHLQANAKWCDTIALGCYPSSQSTRKDAALHAGAAAAVAAPSPPPQPHAAYPMVCTSCALPGCPPPELQVWYGSPRHSVTHLRARLAADHGLFPARLHRADGRVQRLRLPLIAQLIDFLQAGRQAGIGVRGHWHAGRRAGR